MLVNGRWEIVRRLGGGGMGEVHLARDRHQARREVAIKILRAGLADPAAIEGFRAEFRSLARLRHPNLAEVFDFGRVEESGLPFLTMEYVHGHDLGALKRKEALARLDDLVAQCLRALDYIHARGWLHNDIKPHNIRITPAYQVKLLDFGLAQRLAAGAEAGASGTLQYLAPERLAGTAPDARSDLYSLGVVIYELLAGRRPYDAPTPGSLVTAILEGAAPAPVVLDGSISARQNRLVVEMMARDPERRPDSATATFALLNAGLREPRPLDTPETFASWVASGRLVGRDHENETLRLALAGHASAVPLAAHPISTRARKRGRTSGQSAERAGDALAPRVVLISGPPGSGKSRLVREFGQDLQLGGWRTLAARCHETGGPLQPFADLLRTARAAGSLPAPLAEVLDRVFGRRARGTGVSIDKAEMRAGLAACLDHLAGDGPGALLLEDLQWADAAGLDLLEHLVLREERPRWLVVGTLRDVAAADGALGRRLEEILKRSGVKHMALDPLDAEQTTELLASMLPFAAPPRDLATLLVERSAGAPLHVEEILKALFADGLLARRGDGAHWSCSLAAGADLPLPASLAGLVLRQVDALGEDDAQAARMLAVLARPVPLALLARALETQPRGGFTPDSTRRAAEALAALRLVTIDWERDGGPWVSLSQTTARAAIYGALPDAPRRALHRAAAAALEEHFAGRLDDVSEDLARHYVACDARAQAVEYLLRSAHRAAALHDPLGESAFLKRALTLIPESDADTRLEVYEDLCVALLMSLGDQAAGLEFAEQMLLEARRARKRIAEARALRQQSWALGFLGRDQEALARGREALGLARRLRDRREIAACLNYIGMTLARGGHHLQAREQFDEALPMAREEGDPATLTWMLNNASISHLILGDARGASELLTEALEAARRSGLAGPYNRYLGNLGAVRRELGDLTGSIATIEEARAWARQHTTLEILTLQCEALVDAYIPRGRFDLAAAAHAELSRTRALIRPNETEPLTWDLAGQIERGLGRFDAARRAHEAGLAEARRRQDRVQEGYLLVALAADHLAAGEREAARAGALAALDLGRSLAHPRIGFMSDLTLARLAVGPDAGTGAKEIDDLHRRLEGHDERPLRCVDRLDRRLALGNLALAAGDARAAERAANAGLAIAEPGGFREHVWRLRLLLARAQEERGLPRKAASSYHDAIRQIEAIALEIEDTSMRDDYLKTPERAIAARPGDASTTPGASPTTTGAPTIGSASRPDSSQSATRMLSTLFEITQVINSIHDPDELLNKVMDLAIDSVGAERGLIFLSPEDGGEMEPVVARNVERQTIKDATAYSQGVLKEAGRGQAVLTHDAEHDARFKEYRSVVRFHIRSLMCVPLNLRGRTIGTVYVDTRAPRAVFTPDHLKFLEAFAAQAAIAVDNANLFDRVRKENENLRQAVSERYGFESIVGRSTRMRDVFSILARVAPSPLPVMIRGESGTGKELVARAIHQNSPRRDKAFFSENCAALPDTLLESELFGHVRGAFTGAESSRKGLFEMADHGTLFLDEVGDMSMALQSKLLRALQDGEIRPLGAESTRKVNVRVISATNRDLEGMIRARQFREDLYYRLKGISVTLPPLRERRDDIPLLIDHFLGRLANENDQPRLRVEPALLRELSRREWPGNVRELENAIYRLSLFAEKGIITLEAARNDVDSSEPSPSLITRPVNGSISKVSIRKALSASKGNRNQAAKLLGVSRATFFRKMRELGI